jgi:hypothetical protein
MNMEKGRKRGRYPLFQLYFAVISEHAKIRVEIGDSKINQL